MFNQIVPALRRVGIGSDQEPVGKIHKHLAPLIRDFPVLRLLAPEGKIAPQVLVFRQHDGNRLRADKTGMGPENARIRVLCENPVNGVGIGMGMQKNAVGVGQFDDFAHHRQVRIFTKNMKFTNPGIGVFCQSPGNHVDNGCI